MILYMGSMVGLFGNFFLQVSHFIHPSLVRSHYILLLLLLTFPLSVYGQRYILRRPYAGLDMCGVIKSPVAGTIAATQLCGIAELNARGCCVILLPPEFPDPDSTRMTSSLNGIGNNSGSPTSKTRAAFTISYNLTPLGASMPQLFISTELTRFSTSVWKSMGSKSHAKTGSCGSSSDKEKKGSEPATRDATKIQNSSSVSVGFCDKNEETNTKNKTKSNVTSKRKKGTPVFIAENIENISDIELEREQELERIILRNYWATITKSNNLTSASGKIPRSVSTGNIPALYSSPLRYAKSTGNFFNLHNDRLIDGPLPLLRRLGGISSTDICQLDRDESDHSDYNGNYDNDDDDDYSNHENEKLLHEKKEGRRLENSSTPSNNAQPRAIPTNLKNIQKSNQRNISQHSDAKKFPLGIIPLCFTISGGVPSGRVSWMITSLPQENSNSCVLSEKDESENVCSDSDVYDSYSETGFPISGSAGISADWRAL